MKNQNKTLLPDELMWKPLGLENLLKQFGMFSGKPAGLIILWSFLIGLSIFSVLRTLPESGLYAGEGGDSLQVFFLLYPPFLISGLLLFWLGFEWGFVPVFLSTFAIAFSISLPVLWALLFAFSFVLGLGIYALAYYCVPVRIDLRSFRSFSFFIIVSMIAAMASSLGAFVYSLYHGLTPAETSVIWNKWWTGGFFQAVLILGPLLMLFSPIVIRYRDLYFSGQPRGEVTLTWIYSAIAIVVVVLSGFVAGGKTLGTQGLTAALAESDMSLRDQVLLATESFQLIFWISLAIIVIVGFAGINIVTSWNRSLQKEVDEKTSTLIKREDELQKAVDDRDLLLHEIHGRVKKNLSIILALFELQLKNAGKEIPVSALKDSKSRIRAVSMIHEVMAQGGTFKNLNLRSYVNKLTNCLDQDYRNNKTAAEISISSNDMILGLELSVPVCMIVNEIMNRVYEKVNESYNGGRVNVDLYTDTDNHFVVVRDSGDFPALMFEWTDHEDIGIKLIRSLAKQIRAEVLADDYKNSIAIVIPLKVAEQAALMKEVADN